MKELTDETRTKFLENEGRRYAGRDYHRSPEEAFKSLQGFKPLSVFNFEHRADFPAFYRGYKEVRGVTNLALLTAAKAQAENNMVLKELEGRGLPFIQERVDS